MRHSTIATAAAAALLLPASGMATGDEAPKRQPGNWTQAIEITRMTGPGADQAKPLLDQMMAKLSATPVCVTPEGSLAEDPIKKLGSFGGPTSACTFDRKSVAGGVLDVAGTCKKTDGEITRVVMRGTLGSTAQDITMTFDSTDAANTTKRSLEMHIRTARTGDCGPAAKPQTP